MKIFTITKQVFKLEKCKNEILLSIMMTIFCSNLVFSQNSIPSCTFNSTTDVANWTIIPATVSKTWFNGGCKAMFVDNLYNTPSATFTSPAFYVGNLSTYQIQIGYGLIYTTNPVIIELIDSLTSAVISSSSTSTVAGTCTSWPNPKIRTLDYTSIAAGNYRLRVTIPGNSQFFLEGAKSSVNYALGTTENGDSAQKIAYPNPAKDIIYFKNIANISKINIYDASGKLVKSETPKNNSLDISSLKIGNYFLEIKTDKKTIKSQIIKN